MPEHLRVAILRTRQRCLVLCVIGMSFIASFVYGAVILHAPNLWFIAIGVALMLFSLTWIHIADYRYEQARQSFINQLVGKD